MFDKLSQEHEKNKKGSTELSQTPIPKMKTKDQERRSKIAPSANYGEHQLQIDRFFEIYRFDSSWQQVLVSLPGQTGSKLLSCQPRA